MTKKKEPIDKGKKISNITSERDISNSHPEKITASFTGQGGSGTTSSEFTTISSENSFRLSSLISNLVTEFQSGIQAAFLQQIEFAKKEFDLIKSLPEDKLVEYLVTEEEAMEEFKRLLGSEPIQSEKQSKIKIYYKAPDPEKGVEEDPPIKKLTGYEVKPDDIKKGTITVKAQRKILDQIKKKISKERFEAIKEVYNQGVPIIIVDHGKMNVKLSLNVLEQITRQKTSNIENPSLKPNQLKIVARVVDKKNIDAPESKLEAFSEIEISFKIDIK